MLSIEPKTAYGFGEHPVSTANPVCPDTGVEKRNLLPPTPQPELEAPRPRKRNSNGCGFEVRHDPPYRRVQVYIFTLGAQWGQDARSVEGCTIQTAVDIRKSEVAEILDLRDFS